MYYEKNADREGHLYFNCYTRDSHPKYTPIPHYHASVEIYIVAKGKFPIYLNGEGKELTVGEIAFVNGHFPHLCGAPQYKEDFEIYVIVASIGYFDKNIDTDHIAPFTVKNENTEKILSFVMNAYKIKEEMNQEMRKGFTNYLLGMILNYCSSELPAHNKRSDLTVKIMRYIDTNFRENITLHTLAKKFGYTPSYISRSFNQYAGVNLHEYMNRIRYIQTKKLIEADRDTTVADAALVCGFQSVKTYYRIAKQYKTDK